MHVQGIPDRATAGRSNALMLFAGASEQYTCAGGQELLFLRGGTFAGSKFCRYAATWSPYGACRGQFQADWPSAPGVVCAHMPPATPDRSVPMLFSDTFLRLPASYRPSQIPAVVAHAQPLFVGRRLSYILFRAALSPLSGELPRAVASFVSAQ